MKHVYKMIFFDLLIGNSNKAKTNEPDAIRAPKTNFSTIYDIIETSQEKISSGADRN
jgi:hypothetical protein